MGKFVHLDAPDYVIGIRALREIHAQGPKRQQLGVVLDHGGKMSLFDLHSQVFRGDTPVGQMTTNTWSPRLERNIGICLIWSGIVSGDTVTVELPTGKRMEGEMRELPFL